jgi:hypothetical protein
MKKLILILLLSIPSFALKGFVYKEEVCGKMLIEVSDGTYTVAEHYGGTEFDEGTVIFGDFRSYGFKDFYSGSSKGRYYIEDYWLDLEDAYEEACQ